MQKAFVFDFDGVVVDSLEALRAAYYSFLSLYQKVGSDSEFEFLNGPSLTEIIQVLKNTHKISDSFELMYENYMNLLKQKYVDSPLVSGVRECLDLLKQLSVPIMLVTSSKRIIVDRILEIHNLSEIFQYVLTSDDVSISKPSPEIYLKLKNLYRNFDFFVVEDSNNGLVSSIGAGLKTIYFDPSNRGTSQAVLARVCTMQSLKHRIHEIVNDCCVVEESSNLEIFVTNFSPELGNETLRLVDEIWENSSRPSNQFDGEVLYYLSHSVNSQICLINGFWAPYKFFYARHVDKSLNIPFVPLCVSGVSVVDETFFLVGSRKNVTQHESLVEFVPSGGIDRSNCSNGKVNYVTQLLAEFESETGIGADKIVSVETLGLVFDLRDSVVDICCKLVLSALDTSRSLISPEYGEFRFLTLENTEWSKLVPTSRAIYNLILGKR